MKQNNSYNHIEKGFDIAQAFAEANRCLLCYDAPCSKGCPGGTDPGKFIRKLRMRNITGAVRTIKENNVFGLSCGILCPTAQLCEKECSATEIDRPIRIGKIQRFLMEYASELDFNFDYEIKQVTERGNIAVIGSGPAGLTCAAELAKLGNKVTVFEEKEEEGGVLRYGVPEHRFPVEYLKKELKSIYDLGVVIKCNTPVKGDKSVENLLHNGYDAVYIATGLWNPVSLKTKKLIGLFSSTDFLLSMKDGKEQILNDYIKGKTVAVIGGGSVAVDCVESSIKLGAKDTYLIYRRSFTQMPAEEDEKLNMLNGGAHLLLLNQPVDYKDENGILKGIVLRRTKLGDKDAKGRRTPVEIENSEWFLETDVVIEAIGSIPAQDSDKMYPSVEIDNKKIIVIDTDTCATNVKGIFAGGDIANGPSLIIKAARDGKNAAIAINDYLLK